MGISSSKNDLFKFMQFALAVFAFFFVSLFTNAVMVNAGSFGSEVYVTDYKNGTVDFAASFTSYNHADVVDYGEDFSIYAAICNVSVSKSSCGNKTVRIFTTEGTDTPGVTDIYELELNYGMENAKGVISYTYYDSAKSTGPSEPAYLIKKYYTPSIASIKANSTKYSGTPMYNIYIKYVDNESGKFADGYFTYVNHRLCVNGVCEYYYFKDALSTGDNLDIEVVRDVEECFVINSDKNIRIDMKGHKINCKEKGKSTVQNNGKVNVTNSGKDIAYIVGLGTNVFSNSVGAELVLDSANLRIGSAGIPETCIYNMGNLTINKSTVYCGTSIYNVGNAYMNNAVISGDAIGIVNEGYIKVDGTAVSSLKGSAIINKANGTVDILKDSFVETKVSDNAYYAINNEGIATVDLNDKGFISAESAKGRAIYNSGTFNLKNGVIYAACVGIYNDGVNKNSVLNIDNGIIDVVGVCKATPSNSNVRAIAIWTDADGEYKSIVNINGGSVRAYGDVDHTVYYGIVVYKAIVNIDNAQVTSKEYGLYFRTAGEVNVGENAKVYADEIGAFICPPKTNVLNASEGSVEGQVANIYDYIKENETNDVDENELFESVEINEDSAVDGILNSSANVLNEAVEDEKVNAGVVIILVAGMIAFITLMAVVFGKSKKSA